MSSSQGEPVTIGGWAQALGEEILPGDAASALTQGVESQYLDYTFGDLFDLDEIQRMQDAFSQATNAASLITLPDGSPVTRPSGFSELCRLIRRSPKGAVRCRRSDAFAGRYNPEGPNIVTCPAAGLLDVGASISLGDNHLANWLAGQVVVDEPDEAEVRLRAKSLDIDPVEFEAALAKVPRMSHERFKALCQSLFLMAGQLSKSAYQSAMLKEYTAKKRIADSKIISMKRIMHDTLNLMPSVVVALDRQGRILMLNDAADRFLSNVRPPRKGRPFTEVLPGSWVEDPELAESFGKGRSYYRHNVKWHDGAELRYCDVMMYPLDREGEGGAVIRVDDVSERVRLERAMLETEKMTSVGGLAAGMAHEINNPLGGVLQGIQNVLRRVDPAFERNRSVAEEHGLSLRAMHGYLKARGVLSMLDGVRESGERAAGIVQDMLNYSRRSDSSIELCDLNKLIDEIINICSCDYDLTRRYDFKQVDVRRHYDPGCAKVPCIPTEIKQVIFNLLRNAAHAMAGGDTSRAPRIDLTTRMRPGEAVVEVSDNGPGFDEETRKRLFEPFFTTKPAGLGTGLGLSVSFFVVTENHGGALEAESRPGRGATFRVRLPLARRDA